MNNINKIIITLLTLFVMLSNYGYGIKISDLSDTTKLSNYSDKIDILEFENIDIGKIESLRNIKVEALGFYGCIGNINKLISLIDKSELVEISIQYCFFESILNLDKKSYEKIDLSSVKENSLLLNIRDSRGHFEFNNAKVFSDIVFVNSSLLDVDFSELNINLKSLSIINSSSFFSTNWGYISEFADLETLRLEFNDWLRVKLNLKKLTKLTRLTIMNCRYFPEEVTTNKLTFLLIENVNNLDKNELNKIIGKNIELKELYINKCNLFKIPSNIFQLKKLSILSLDDNKISSLDFDFSKLEKLWAVFLDNNYISEFNYDILNLPSINQVNIELNNLKKRLTNNTDKKNLIINQEGNSFEEK